MARMTFVELNAALDACIAAGAIFNVDYQDWKSYVATRMLEADLQQVTNALYLDIPHDVRVESDNEIYWAKCGVSIVTFPSKKLIKALETKTAYAEGTTEVVNQWTPVAEKFRTLKSMIVMGRKPAETPRQTPVRTLENTGTCSCCGMNVKLKDGKIVQHGYTIKYGWQSGVCFGRGYVPIEVSPEGAVAYNEELGNLLVRINRNKTNLIAKRPDLEIRDRYTAKVTATLKDGDDKYDRVLEGRVREMESEIRQIEYEITIFTKKIATWTPGVLPG
jgi:hypothetical protein